MQDRYLQSAISARMNREKTRERVIANEYKIFLFQPRVRARVSSFSHSERRLRGISKVPFALSFFFALAGQSRGIEIFRELGPMGIQAAQRDNHRHIKYISPISRDTWEFLPRVLRYVSKGVAMDESSPFETSGCKVRYYKSSMANLFFLTSLEIRLLSIRSVAMVIVSPQIDPLQRESFFSNEL